MTPSGGQDDPHRQSQDLWAGHCQRNPWREETRGPSHWFCFNFELVFSVVSLIASDVSLVYILLGCMAGEVCVPDRRELWRNAREREGLSIRKWLYQRSEWLQPGLPGATRAQAFEPRGRQLREAFIPAPCRPPLCIQRRSCHNSDEDAGCPPEVFIWIETGSIQGHQKTCPCSQNLSARPPGVPRPALLRRWAGGGGAGVSLVCDVHVQCFPPSQRRRLVVACLTVGKGA